PGQLSHRTFHYLVTHYLIQWLGLSEETIRLLPAVLGVLGIPLVYVVGRAFFGRWVALLGTALLAFSAFHVRYSQTARFYAGMVFFSLLAIAFLTRALRRGRWYDWLGFTLAMTLNLYNHLFAAFLLASLGLWAVAVLGARLARARSVLERREALARLSALIASGAVVTLLFAPALWNMRLKLLEQVASPSGSGATSGGGSVAQLGALARPANAGTDKISLRELAVSFGAGGGHALALFVALFVAGLVALALRRRWEPLLLTLLGIGVPYATLTILQPKHFFAPKYLIFLEPLYLLVIGYGLASLVTATHQALRRARWVDAAARWVAVTGLALALSAGVSLATYHYLTTYYKPWRDPDPRGAAAFVSAHAAPSDGVAVANGTRILSYLYYDARQRGVGIETGRRQIARLKTLTQAERLQRRGATLWVVVGPLPPALDPQVYQWLVQNALAIPFNRFTIYVKPPADRPLTLDQRIALLEEAWRASETPNGAIPQELGELYLNRGDWDRAVAAYRAADRARPATASALISLAHAYADRGDLGGALATYQEVTRRFPSVPSYYQSLGDAYHAVGLPEAALAAYERMDAASGSPASSLVAQGEHALRVGAVDEAVAALQRAVERDPKRLEAWAELATAYRRAGKTREADDAYQRALALPRTDPNAVMALAQESLERRQYDDAATLARQARDLSWSSPLDVLDGLHHQQRLHPPHGVIAAEMLLGAIAEARQD
ncbi:MAG: glycosyltransferase family 39 protein, partial [Thermomicrobiaceae bacterium]|nr:glycosyltransferase family 39 protein [Thermomicrobiaceae bacterium]